MSGQTYDVGEVIPITATITNTAGLVDPASLALTVTDPSGAALTYPAAGAITHDSLGKYHVDYGPTTLAGRYGIRWVATGAGAGAYTDVVHALPIDPRFLLSLADARSALRKTAADVVDDDDLRLYMAATTTIVEDIAGAQAAIAKTHTFSGGRASVNLPATDVTVTGVTENGQTLTANQDFIADAEAGIVYRGNQQCALAFFPGVQNVVVTYTAGTAGGTSNVRLAARIILRHLWTADQQGPSRPSVGSSGMQQALVGTPSGFLVPKRAYELLASMPHAVLGFA